MDPTELAECEELVRQFPEYGWLLESDRPGFNSSGVAERHQIAIAKVKEWREKYLIPGAELNERSGRWRMPRSGLIVFFGRRLRASTGACHAEE